MVVLALLWGLSSQVLPVVPAASTKKAACLVGATGQIECGFGCERSASGKVGCASEPGGVCSADVTGRVECSEPLGLTIRLPLTKARCISGADGSVGCGYDCVVDVVGAVHCANSPDGACAVSPTGQATCTRFDLSRRVFVLDAVPTPECLRSTDGDVRCGFGCVKGARGFVRCALTPDGACRAGVDGVVVCTDFDPAQRIFLGAPPDASCVRDARGRAVCGYGCATDSIGGARCSRSPFGACGRRTDGFVRCFPDDDTKVDEATPSEP